MARPCRPARQRLTAWRVPDRRNSGECSPLDCTRSHAEVRDHRRPAAVGQVRIAGAKNAVLKMMAAAVLTDEPVMLRNVPKISDVTILREVMSRHRLRRAPARTATRSSSGRAEAAWPFVPLEAAAKMRASFILLGPMLARFGRVILPNPGGDRIGRRPVDCHVTAMEAMGATIEYRNGYYYASAPADGLRGARDRVPGRHASWAPRTPCWPPRWRAARRSSTTRRSSRRWTTSSPCCAPWARGSSAPTSGASRSRASTSLRGVEHRVIGDRLEAETFAIAAAITRGGVTLEGVRSRAPRRIPRGLRPRWASATRPMRPRPP